ncbi:hypothetical protein CL616_05060 [archaeon]|nr:hypothetical protein [archaeon]
MVFSHKKGAASMEQITILLAAIAGLIVILLIYTSASGSFLNFDFFSSTSCWASNGIKCSGGAFTFVSSLCSPQKIDEPIDQEQLASLLRDTYYMYHRSECDLNNIGGELYVTYFFEVDQEISISSFIAYLFENNRGEPEKDMAKTDIAYLEENTQGNTLCFDTNYDEIADFKLKPKKTYYIHYWDRDSLLYPNQGDRIIITRDSNIITTQDILEDTFINVGSAAILPGVLGLGAVIITSASSGYSAVEKLASGQIMIVNKYYNKKCLEYGIPI